MLSKSIDQWLSDYGESHQHPVNKQIHWLCVPLILWSVLALLWPVGPDAIPWLNAATVLIAISLLFYLTLSWTLTLGMGLITVASLLLILLYQSLDPSLPLWGFALLVFVLAWIGQFIGHQIEGKKPSFFKDVQFLLIGPAWLMSFVYRKLGIPISRR
ncbi:MAG: Mpo1 family 2-hydroxy fatty acid dioxygenase [Saccharospirillum sp.]